MKGLNYIARGFRFLLVGGLLTGCAHLHDSRVCVEEDSDGNGKVDTTFCFDRNGYPNGIFVGPRIINGKEQMVVYGLEDYESAVSKGWKRKTRDGFERRVGESRRRSRGY